MAELVSRERLLAVLNYDPETGVFLWKVGLSNVVAGSVAGYISRGYRLIAIDGRNYFAARLAWLYITGEWPEADVDHWDLDKSNDRFGNLRAATRSQNNANAPAPKTNRSGRKGVHWHAQRRKWVAAISVENRTRYLGIFEDIDAAAAAYQAAAIERHGEFARIA